MTSHSGPIYEVNFFVAPDVADECEHRIEEHARRVLLDPAVADCTIFARDNDDQGRLRRVCLHNLTGDDVLDDFIDGPGSELEAQLAAEFGELVEVQSRVLREDQLTELLPEASPNCLNCGARLRGQYCGTCGQRSRSRLISLWELISDAFGDLFELDSRLWQTLVPLMIRPGRLTHDYLQGRRARYMPPFRMYLVLSLLFFVIAFFNPNKELGLLFEPEPVPVTEEEVAVPPDAAEQAQEVIDEDTSGNLQIDENGFRFTLDEDDVGVDDECNVDASDLEELPGWLSRRLTVERLQRACERTRLDDGEGLKDNLVDNIPAALIVLLPLMAFVLKALYPLSKRYYVEHLLFFVHFHAFFFMMLTLQILFMRLSSRLRIPEEIAILTIVVTSFYIAIYLFVAMRRVYGQGRIITFLKYVALVIAYTTGFALTMLGALAIAVFSI